MALNSTSGVLGTPGKMLPATPTPMINRAMIKPIICAALTIGTLAHVFMRRESFSRLTPHTDEGSATSRGITPVRSENEKVSVTDAKEVGVGELR